MDREERAIVRNKLAGIDGIHKKADRLLRTLILDLSKTKAVSRKKVVDELESIRNLLSEVPSLKVPIREIVDKESKKMGWIRRLLCGWKL